APSLQKDLAIWRERGEKPELVELGTLFGLRGEVIDMRRLLVVVSPQDSRDKALAAGRALEQKFSITTQVLPSMAVRPTGVLEAKDERGTTIRNDGVVWLAPTSQAGTLA